VSFGVGHNMKRLLAFLVYALGLSGVAHAAPLSSGQFTQAFAKTLRSTQPTLSVIVKGDLELLVKNPDGQESTAFLDKAYSQYKMNPKEIDNVLRIYITSFIETSKELDIHVLGPPESGRPRVPSSPSIRD